MSCCLLTFEPFGELDGIEAQRTSDPVVGYTPLFRQSVYRTAGQARQLSGFGCGNHPRPPLHHRDYIVQPGTNMPGIGAAGHALVIFRHRRDSEFSGDGIHS